LVRLVILPLLKPNNGGRKGYRDGCERRGIYSVCEGVTVRSTTTTIFPLGAMASDGSLYCPLAASFPSLVIHTHIHIHTHRVCRYRETPHAFQQTTHITHKTGWRFVRTVRPHGAHGHERLSSDANAFPALRHTAGNDLHAIGYVRTMVHVGSRFRHCDLRDTACQSDNHNHKSTVRPHLSRWTRRRPRSRIDSRRE
jgi:hypothetical protein